MKLNPKARLPLIITAWLGTALVTYSLGRMSAPSLSGSGSDRSFGNSATSSPTGTGLLSSSGAQGSAEGSLANWFGKRATSVADVTGGKSLEEHLKHLLKQDDEASRMLGFLRLLEALNTPADLQAALEIIGKAGGRPRMSEQAMLFQKWAQLNPKEAAEFAGKQNNWSRMMGLDAVLRTWVKASPEDAIAWAQQNGANIAQEGDRGQGGRGGPGREENWAMASLINSLAESSLDRALQVASSQPTSQARGRMVDSLVNQLMTQRGEEGARSAILDMPDDAFRAGMAGRVADRMANEDPQKAAQWALGLPAGDTRERAVAEAVSEWAQKDPVAAGNYLLQFGSSPEFDDARQRYASEVVRRDPEGAMPWALAITDEQQRAIAVQETLRSWARRDAPAAQAWAATNGVTIVADGGRGGRPEGFRDRGRP
jgi:hypothetical protein